jgi:Arc/MetJ family transcription regulator
MPHHLRMATERLDLDGDLLAQVRELAGPDGVAGFVERAIRRELRHEHLDRLLDELEAEVGPLPAELLAEADAFWHAG